MHDIKELMGVFHNPATLVTRLGFHAGETVDKTAQMFQAN